MHALLPEERGGQKQFKDFAVRELPDDPTAQGFRRGCVNFLATVVPSDFASHFTGHDLTNLGALWEYMEATSSLVMPAAVCMVGFKGFQYGRIGVGPTPPSLDAIKRVGGDVTRALVMMDTLFCFHDDSPPQLLEAGKLRPIVVAAFSCLIMYYEERYREDEALIVLSAMRDAFTDSYSKYESAHETFTRWGREMKAQYERHNIHLTTGEAHDADMQKVCDTILTVNAQMGKLFDAIGHLTLSFCPCADPD